MANHERFHLRWLIRSDLPEALAIEAACGDPPWSEEEFLATLRRRSVIAMVAESTAPGNPIAGFFVYEIRRAHLEVLSLAVAPGYRRRGIGRAMVAKLAGKLNSRRSRLVLRVREAGLDAQLFLRAIGIRATGVDRDHFGGGEDAFVFAHEWEPAPAMASR